jgi:hypothetical protein
MWIDVPVYGLPVSGCKYVYTLLSTYYLKFVFLYVAEEEDDEGEGEGEEDEDDA